MRLTKRIFDAVRSTLMLMLAVLAALALPVAAHAQESETIVRVGWYESPFNTTDELGRRSGYAYDYQQKIAAYTGWTYEYVTGSWPELMQMLEEGRIDLMSDVSYTDERAEKMLFSALSMGTEEYYLFTAPGNTEITPEDFSTFDGKKVGANKGSVQITCFQNWAEANGVKAEIVEMTGTERLLLLIRRLRMFWEYQLSVRVLYLGWQVQAATARQCGRSESISIRKAEKPGLGRCL